MVDQLLNNGAEPNAKNPLGWTPLHIASQFSGTDVVSTLLQAGADCNVQNSEG